MFHHFIVDYYQVENFNMSDRYLTKAGMQILLASGLGGLQRTVGHFEVGLFPQRLLFLKYGCRRFPRSVSFGVLARAGLRRSVAESGFYNGTQGEVCIWLHVLSLTHCFYPQAHTWCAKVILS